MIFIALLFAPTVPSDPSPQNLQDVVPSLLASISIGASDVLVTSSKIPIVKLFLGFSAFKFSNTPAICEGVGSFEPNPNLPPTTFIALPSS